MKKSPISALLLTLLATTALSDISLKDTTAPTAEKIPKDVTVHGDKRIDDYFWLREEENPKVTEHLNAENKYTETVLAPAAALRETLYKEMVGRMRETDTSVPSPYKSWRYYHRTEAGKQHEIHCRKSDKPDASEEIILDVNKLAEGKSYTELGDFIPHPNGEFLFYSVDWTGYREYEAYVLHLADKKLIEQKIGLIASGCWGESEDVIYYITENEAKRADKLHRYEIKTGKSTLVYEEKDELFDLDVYQSRDEKFIFCSSDSMKTSEARVLDCRNPAAGFKIITKREENHDYRGNSYHGKFYIRTNKNAPNYKLVTAPWDKPGTWSDLVPHRASVQLNGFELFDTFISLIEREHGLPQISLLNPETNKSLRIEMPEATYDVLPFGQKDPTAKKYWMKYESMVSPMTVFAVDPNSGSREVLKRHDPPTYAPAEYKTERIFATAADGVKIPLSVVYRKDLDRTKPQKFLLSGYGSYGESEAAYFDISKICLLDRGFICATAHIRGGGEYGDAWREAGRMGRKMTTFTDFIACAEHLIKEGWTSPRLLGIIGGSAGGMLVGATLNLKPDLFGAAVLEVPFVDVLNTMLDDTIPLTTGEYIEWGNPTIKEEYGWMRAYSPYDNIRATEYPHVLAISAIHDSQVPYWEAAKYIAKLRSTRTDSRASLLYVELESGHGGSSGRYDFLKDIARWQAFLIQTLAEK